MKTQAELTAADMLQDWADFDNQEKRIVRALRDYLLKNNCLLIDTAHPKGRIFKPVVLSRLDENLGLAYTSTSSCAALWLCNANYLMFDNTRHLVGLTIGKDGNFYAWIEDENEQNQEFIKL